MTIEFRNLNFAYDTEPILKQVNLTVATGELLALVGPSGSGKTTLLKMVNGLLTPTTGEVLINQQPLTSLDLLAHRRQTGYVLQQGALFPNLTVAENLAVLPKLNGWSPRQIKTTTAQWLQEVDLPTTILNRHPAELSGGQQQRIGIVRALMTQPPILLMDEPFSALDAITRQQLQTLTKQLQAKYAPTTIFVTHDMQEALTLADRVAVMQAGRIIQVATPAELQAHPVNDFVDQLIQGGTHA